MAVSQVAICARAVLNSVLLNSTSALAPSSLFDNGDGGAAFVRMYGAADASRISWSHRVRI